MSCRLFCICFIFLAGCASEPRAIMVQQQNHQDLLEAIQELEAQPLKAPTGSLEPMELDSTELDITPAYVPPAEPEFMPEHILAKPLNVKSENQKNLYLTPFLPGHSECEEFSENIMACPTNALNERQPGEPLGDFLDRELVRGLVHRDDYPKDCFEQDGNIMICPMPKFVLDSP